MARESPRATARYYQKTFKVVLVDGSGGNQVVVYLAVLIGTHQRVQSSTLACLVSFHRVIVPQCRASLARKGVRTGTCLMVYVL